MCIRGSFIFIKKVGETIGGGGGDGVILVVVIIVVVIVVVTFSHFGLVRHVTINWWYLLVFLSNAFLFLFHNETQKTAFDKIVVRIVVKLQLPDVLKDRVQQVYLVRISGTTEEELC